MVKAKIYNLKGEAVGEEVLPANLFEVPVKANVVHEVLRGLMNNRRQPLAHTKTRGEVRGGGKKPWRQKGTGRARHGSTRSPIWIGGGVTFGPRSTRNFSVKINRKMKRAALGMALTDKAESGMVILLDEIRGLAGKTKQLADLAKILPLGKKTLFIIPEKNELVMRACRNLPSLRVVTVNAFSMEDVLRHKSLFLPVATLPALQHLYGNT